MTETTENTGLLPAFADTPDADIDEAIAAHDPGVLVEELARRLASRMDPGPMGKAGVVVQYTCHTADDSISRFVTWDPKGWALAASYDGARQPAKMEWQRLTDAVRYELGRITLQGVGLVGRFSMAATRADIQTIIASERPPEGGGKIIRGLKAVGELSGRAREKALRAVDVDALLLEQQQATNEALRIFNLLDELSGNVIEWRVGDGSDEHIVQSIYRDGEYRVELGEPEQRAALLHFSRLTDFVDFLNGHTTVPKVAMEGNLKVDGDFHLLEILGRIPEPFDPVERWGTL